LTTIVSALVPTYNCGPYLRESLDSLLAQDLPPGTELEVVVVDDGSTDETPGVLASYGDRVRVVPGDHEGLAAARNTCVAHARGDWVAFHDADDVALPGRIAHHLAFLGRHPDHDAVFANGERMDGGGRVIRSSSARKAAGRVLTAADLFDGFPVFFQGALVRRRAIQRAGAWDTTYRVQPDVEYAYRLLPHCRATFVDEVVFHYRWHASNTSRDFFGSRLDVTRMLERIDREDPATRQRIGVDRLRDRVARHHYKIAKARFRGGDVSAARASLARALALRPLDLRFRWLQLRGGA